MKINCIILIITVLMFALSCNSDVKTGTSVDTSWVKKVKKKDDDLKTEPQGAQWDTAKKLIAKSDCQACHKPFEMVTAPPYIMIAKRYDATPATVAKLANSIIKGSYDVWHGYGAMNEHRHLSKKEARLIVEYILAFKPKR